MSVLGPLMLAMTAATPGYQGFLANTDTRWDVFRLGLDDRTSDELLQMVCLVIFSHALFWFSRTDHRNLDVLLGNPGAA